MDKSEFQKYIDEMKKMSKKAMLSKEAALPVAAPPQTAEAEAITENLSGEGYILVNVTAVERLFPVENAKVTVFKGDVLSMERLDEDTTDQSGKTKLFSLPAPPISLAQNENNTKPVFSTYNILTEADGFLPTVNYNAAVFDGVTSIQNVNLIPKTSFNENDANVFDENNDYNL